MKSFIAAAASLLALGTAQAQGTTYAIEPTHTFVGFEISHFGTSTNRGRWDKKAGTVQFDRAAKTGRVELTIDMNSINTGVPQFEGHLKSKDFFNTAEHPAPRSWATNSSSAATRSRPWKVRSRWWARATP